MDNVYVGIDIAKAHLDLAIDSINDQPPPKRFENTPEGHAAIIKQLRGLNVHRVVLEATAGYQRAAVAVLLTQGLPVVVVNPRQARDFPKATGQLAKTDSLDANVLAKFARVIQPKVRATRRSSRFNRRFTLEGDQILDTV